HASPLWLLPSAGTLARAPISGAAPRQVTESVVFADWSPDGTQLAVVRQTASGQALEYPLGNKIYETAGMIFMPKVSPSGDLVAFLDTANADFTGNIVVVDAKGQKRLVSPHLVGVFGQAWSPEGSEILFASLSAGMTSVEALSMNGQVRQIFPLPGMFELLD